MATKRNQKRERYIAEGPLGTAGVLQTMKEVIQLDGWNIAVDWHQLYGGDSFFIPSVNVDFDKAAVAASAEQVNCAIAMKVVVEEGIQGIRVWIERGVL